MSFLRFGLARAIGGAVVVGCLLSLAGCGAALSDGAQVRVLNATTVSSALDFYSGSDKTFYDIEPNAIDGYSNLTAGTYTFTVTGSDDTSTLATTSGTLVTQDHYLFVAYGSSNGVGLTTLAEDETSPSSGYAKIRVLNGSKDAGTLDVFLTSSSQSIDSVSPTVSSAAVGTASSYTTIASGTYRLRVTGEGDSSDLRLDYSSVTLDSGSVVTLVVTPSAGGYLVNAIDVVQQGSTTTLSNPSARVRVVAGATANGTVSGQVGDTSLASGLPSPSVGNYTLVPAGSQALAFSVNGASLASQTVALSAGGDYTALVYGPATSAAMTLLTDDNTLPSSSSKLKMRLVNAQYGSSGNLTLSVDYTALASNVAYPSASSYATLTSTTDSYVQVTSSASSTALYSASSVSLSAQSVYTMFMLGDTSTTGVLRKDR